MDFALTFQSQQQYYEDAAEYKWWFEQLRGKVFLKKTFQLTKRWATSREGLPTL